METKQTAVEFLIEHIKLDAIHKAKSIDEWVNVFQQAKAMEKEQIKNAFYRGIQEQQNRNISNWDIIKSPEQYYEETYGK